MLENVSLFMARLSTQKHLKAIRDGIVATLPLIIVGSLFLIVAFPPFPADWSITKQAAAHANEILLPYRMTMFIMALYAVMGIGYSLANSYELDGISGAIIASAGYLLTIVPVFATAGLDTLSSGNFTKIVAAGTEGANGTLAAGFYMPMTNLGSPGLFVGMIVAMLSVEILRLFTKSGLTIKMPDSVPPAVARSFEALTPTLVVVLLFGTLSQYLAIDLHGIMATVVKPLVKASDSLPSVWILVGLTSFFWSFGIHGASVVGSLARPLWLTLLEQNQAALEAGKALPNIAPEPFYQWFIYIGGSGATIGLAFLLAFAAKSSYGKTLGRTALGSSIFNINEPILFGAPVVLNPVLIPPFIFVPIVNGTIAYIATSLGLVNRVVQQPPWTLPAPIGAFMATNGDWRAIVLATLMIVTSILMYYPFFKIYDKNLLAEENAAA